MEMLNNLFDPNNPKVFWPVVIGSVFLVIAVIIVVMWFRRKLSTLEIKALLGLLKVDDEAPEALVSADDFSRQLGLNASTAESVLSGLRKKKLIQAKKTDHPDVDQILHELTPKGVEIAIRLRVQVEAKHSSRPKGTTIWDLISAIFERYGLLTVGLLIVVPVLVGCGLIWALTHWSAKPGTKVEFFKGMVSYTRSVPDSLGNPINGQRLDNGWNGVWSHQTQISHNGISSIGITHITVKSNGSVLGTFTNCSTKSGEPGGGHLRAQLSENLHRLTGEWANWRGQHGPLNLTLATDRKTFEGTFSIEGINSVYRWSGTRSDEAENRRLTRACPLQQTTQ